MIKKIVFEVKDFVSTHFRALLIVVALLGVAVLMSCDGPLGPCPNDGAMRGDVVKSPVVEKDIVKDVEKVVEKDVVKKSDVKLKTSKDAVYKNSRGDFVVKIKGSTRFIEAVVDTGAPKTLLKYYDAARLGVDVGRLRFDKPVYVGGGTAYEAWTVVKRMQIGDIVLTNVSVAITKSNYLQESLFGLDTMLLMKKTVIENGKMVFYN